MIQQDPAAIHMLNKMEPQVIQNFNDTMKVMYGKVDKQVDSALGLSAKAKFGDNFNYIESVKATNPKASGTIKASFDQDITKRIHLNDGTVIDVTSGELQKLVDKATYDVAGHPPLKSFDPDGIGEILLTKTDANGVKIPRHPMRYFHLWEGRPQPTN